MKKVIAFKFFKGEFTVRYGYLNHLDLMFVGNKYDEEKDLKGYPRTIMLGSEPGKIYNNFIWYEWSGSSASEETCRSLALKAFKARENILLHKAQQEIDIRIEHERYLEGLINERETESKTL